MCWHIYLWRWGGTTIFKCFNTGQKRCVGIFIQGVGEGPQFSNVLTRDTEVCWHIYLRRWGGTTIFKCFNTGHRGVLTYLFN